VLGLFGTAVVMLAGFVAVERRVTHPVVELALLTKPPLTAAHLGALLLGVNQFAVYVTLPKLAELPTGNPGFGLSVTGAALVLVPGTLLTMPASWAAPAIADRFGVRAPLAVGLALAAAGTALLAVAHGSVWHAVLNYSIASVGWGLAMAALPRMVNAACPPAQSGSANGLNTVARTVGGALGGQLAAAMLASWAGINTGFTVAFSIAAGVAAMGGLLVPLWRYRDRTD
jgi:MFS family permease